MIEKILICAISVFLGGIVTPILLNILFDKVGWFK